MDTRQGHHLGRRWSDRHCSHCTRNGNLVNDLWIPQSLMDKATTMELHRLREEGTEPRRVDRFISLDVQLGDPCVKGWFGVGKTFAVKVSLGTSLIDRFSGRYSPSIAGRTHKVRTRADQ